MASTNQNEEFHYVRSRAFYLTLVEKNFEEGSTHCAGKLKNTIRHLKTEPESHLQRHYEVYNANGREVLIQKRKTALDPIVQVLSHGDVFDMFIKHHIDSNHSGGRNYLLGMEKDKYIFPDLCLTLVLRSCNVCRLKSRKTVKTLYRVSSVYVTVMIQERTETDFRYLLIYLDKVTGFVVLRPLKDKSDIEITMEIFKILTQFGPPQKLCLYGYNTAVNERVAAIIKQICPMFQFEIECKSANFNPAAKVIEKLRAWMSANKNEGWEIGCLIVQREMNIEIQFKVKRGTERAAPKYIEESPHNIYFGNIKGFSTDRKIAENRNENSRKVHLEQSYNTSQNTPYRLFLDNIEVAKNTKTNARKSIQQEAHRTKKVKSKGKNKKTEQYNTCETPDMGEAIVRNSKNRASVYDAGNSKVINQETTVEDAIVELSIPSPENFQGDPLSLLDDLEFEELNNPLAGNSLASRSTDPLHNIEPKTLGVSLNYEESDSDDVNLASMKEQKIKEEFMKGYE